MKLLARDNDDMDGAEVPSFTNRKTEEVSQQQLPEMLEKKVYDSDIVAVRLAAMLHWQWNFVRNENPDTNETRTVRKCADHLQQMTFIWDKKARIFRGLFTDQSEQPATEVRLFGTSQLPNIGNQLCH